MRELFYSENLTQISNLTLNLGNYTRPWGVVINELLYDPDGDETEGEFVELYNALNRSVNLTGWGLSDQDGEVDFTFPDFTLNPPADFAVGDHRITVEDAALKTKINFFLIVVLHQIWEERTVEEIKKAIEMTNGLIESKDARRGEASECRVACRAIRQEPPSEASVACFLQICKICS